VILECGSDRANVERANYLTTKSSCLGKLWERVDHSVGMSARKPDDNLLSYFGVAIQNHPSSAACAKHS